MEGLSLLEGLEQICLLPFGAQDHLQSGAHGLFLGGVGVIGDECFAPLAR